MAQRSASRIDMAKSKKPARRAQAQPAASRQISGKYFAYTFLVLVIDFPEWIPLVCDLSRMPRVEPFRLAVFEATREITDAERRIPFPRESYRSQ